MNKSENIEMIAAAIREIQTKLPAVGKDSTGYGYTYASLPEVCNKVYPLATDQGLGISQVLDESLGGVPAITTLLMHESGQWISGTYPLAEAGMKGVNNAQQFGAAITYARRYGLLAVLGIPVADDDAACLNPKPAAGKKTTTADKKPSITFEQARDALKQVSDHKNLLVIKAKMKDMDIDDIQKNTLRDLYLAAQDRVKASEAA